VGSLYPLLGRRPFSSSARCADETIVIATTSGVVPDLLGIAFIILSVVAYRWVTPTVGGQRQDGAIVDLNTGAAGRP